MISSGSFLLTSLFVFHYSFSRSVSQVTRRVAEEIPEENNTNKLPVLRSCTQSPLMPPPLAPAFMTDVYAYRNQCDLTQQLPRGCAPLQSQGVAGGGSGGGENRISNIQSVSTCYLLCCHTLTRSSKYLQFESVRCQRSAYILPSSITYYYVK